MMPVKNLPVIRKEFNRSMQVMNRSKNRIHFMDQTDKDSSGNTTASIKLLNSKKTSVGMDPTIDMKTNYKTSMGTHFYNSSQS